MKFHLELSKLFWKNLIKPGDTIIDATLGNGHDALFLAKLLKGIGKLICYDVQEEAMKSAEKRLLELSAKERSIVSLVLRSHENFLETSADLIVYNLGYLPGADKRLTTQAETTVQSLKSALSIAKSAISITCYPGHEEGLKEEKAILAFLKTVNFKEWEVTYHTLLNRERAPSLIWIKRHP